MKAEVVKNAVTRRGVVKAVAWFLAALLMAGCIGGIGQSFLGISTLAAVSGLSGGCAAALGAAIGSVRNPGLLAATAGLFAARLVLTLWIGGFPFPRKNRRLGQRAANRDHGAYRSAAADRPGVKRLSRIRSERRRVGGGRFTDPILGWFTDPILGWFTDPRRGWCGGRDPAPAHNRRRTR